jgi:hypothetical protein
MRGIFFEPGVDDRVMPGISNSKFAARGLNSRQAEIENLFQPG